MEESVIQKFLNPGSGDGSGSGSGDGSGSGSGDGSGYGSGEGYVSGSGDGSGSGSGDGSGSGSGYGSGYGSGDGSGSGSGDGSGDGYVSGSGFKSIFAAGGVKPVWIIDGVPTVLTRVHGNAARGFIVQDDLQLTPCYVVKGGGKFAHGRMLDKARQALEEKILDDMPVEEKITEFLKKFQPGREYPARDFYEWHHFLTGSCEQGREIFAKEHGIDIDTDKLTPEAFMALTKDNYGGAVIKQLIEVWKNEED